MFDSLGQRMKTYEYVTRQHLVRRTPVIIRIDGKAFHTLTDGLKKPFDDILMGSMAQTTKMLCGAIQGSCVGYTQSDEISILLQDWATLETAAWFDDNVQKMCSVSASMATLFFNNAFGDYVSKMADAMGDGLLDFDKEELSLYIGKVYRALFDARVWNLPKDEVVNYFIWRQQDAIRNSIQMVGQANYSHKELDLKGQKKIKEMLLEKGIDWDKLPLEQQRGVCVIKKDLPVTDDTEEHTPVVRPQWTLDREIPLFTEDRAYIGKFVGEEA